jgi:hypothetical protein
MGELEKENPEKRSSEAIFAALLLLIKVNLSLQII